MLNSRPFLTLICGAVLVTTACIAYSCYTKYTIKKNQIKPQTLEAKLQQEIASIKSHSNTETDANLDYIWVLSARYTYLKTLMASSPQNSNALDKNDGYNRVRLAIELGRRVAAKKLDKDIKSLTLKDIERSGPTILYNGEKESNNALKYALDMGQIRDYPQSKFYIFSLPQDKLHTGGQFESFFQQVRDKKIDLTNARVAIITHAYHWLRVGRYFGIEPFLSIIKASGASFTAYLVDRIFNAPGAPKDLEAEIRKMPGYIKNGIIAADIPIDITYNGYQI
jgi:hypothetical protein